MVFILKKLVSRLFFPVPLCMELFAVGLVLLWFTGKQRAGKILVTVGAGFFLLLSYPPMPNFLLRPLERHYKPYALALPDSSSAFSRSADTTINYIVVLGGGHVADPQLPVTSQISPSTMARLIEAMRLKRQVLPHTKLVLSGGGPFSTIPNAHVMQQLALELGMDSSQIVLEPGSFDTHDEARLLRPLLGKAPFVLVSSASHLPRAVAMFRKQGTVPIPAPTMHEVKDRSKFHPGTLFPGAGNLQKAEAAFYEYLGLTWAKLKGLL